MHGNLRTLIVVAIPTVAALIGFLWFRRKKKHMAIEKKKPNEADQIKVKETDNEANNSHIEAALNKLTDSVEPIIQEEKDEKAHVEEQVVEEKLISTETLSSSKPPVSSCDQLSTEDSLCKDEEIIVSESMSLETLPPNTVLDDVILNTVKELRIDEINANVINHVEGKKGIKNTNASGMLGGETQENQDEVNQIAVLDSSCGHGHTNSLNMDVNDLILDWSQVEVDESALEQEEDSIYTFSAKKDSPRSKTSTPSPRTSPSVSGSSDLPHSPKHSESPVNDADTKLPSDCHSHLGTGDSNTKHSEVTVNGTASNALSDTQSEVSSDSGHGQSAPETPVATPNEAPEDKVYDFDFPTDLCGRLIGKFGKNINSIKDKTGAEIVLTRKPFMEKFQVCSIEGTQGQIKAALEEIKRRFPPSQFPEITYEKIETKPVLSPGIMQLSLPEGVSVDVLVSSIVEPNHVFLQQPTHPTFSSLERLNFCMNQCYGQDSVVPQLPRPIEAGVICASPMFNGWFRAQVMASYPETDECSIKFVDYGGYMTVQGCILRQIRSDFTTLPFQAVECYMSNVIQPKDDEGFPSEAVAVLEQMVQGKILQAQITSFEEDGVPYIQLFELLQDKTVFVNRDLVNAGVARWIEMS